MNLEWDDIPDAPYYSERTRKSLRDYFFKNYRWRMKRIDRDFKWLQKKMEKMGLNPEDARYLM